MRLIKPLWLNHGGEKKDFEVYSCHVSADGLRLVTAAGDGYVRIWSTEAIKNGTDSSFTKPKQLAALSYHTGTIHAVRFSANDKYLASGADDKIVCVYVLDHSAPPQSTFGSTESPPVENWRIYRRLIGHENDVQDLGWSPDSSVLVSVGLDSRVVVWSGYTFEKLKTINMHGSHVKGITFDPAGKYFATASDDRTIRIFRYTPPAPNASAYDQGQNFTIETTISAPFVTSPLTTYFRRCSWSPDGLHIAGANAVNCSVSTAVIIERGTWESPINLIGHEGPVEVCAFSPRIFSKDPANQADPAHVTGLTVLACAGQDRNLSVWNTNSSKPFCVSENLAMKSISDLAWTPDGESLFFTSLDGTIGLLQFSKGELGYPVSLDFNEHSLAKFGASRKLGMAEGPDGLILEEKSKSDEMRNVQDRMGELMGDPQSAKPNGSADRSNSTTHLNGFTVSTTKPTDGVVQAQLNGDTPSDTQATSKPSAATTEDPTAARVEKLKQRVTYTKDGKKRVAPLLVSTSAGLTESSLPEAQLKSASQQVVHGDAAPQSTLDLSKPFEGLPKGGLASMLFGNKRKFAELGGEDDSAISQKVAANDREGNTSILMNTTDGLTLPSQVSASQPLISSSLAASQIRLAIPTIRPFIQRPMNGLAAFPREDNDNTKTSIVYKDTNVLEVKNPTGPSRTGRSQDKEPARVTVTRNGQTMWHDFLPKPVGLVTGNVKFWAASCDDGSLFVWSPAGRRLFNAFAIESQISILDSRGPWLLCISAVGLCHVWNIQQSTSPHPPVSLAPVLDIAAHSQGPHLGLGPGVIFARLNSEGRIVVAMSNGDAYAYSTSMHVWQRLSEAWWAVGSQYWNSSESTQLSSSRVHDLEENDVVRSENISAGIIPLLERNTTSQTLLRGRASLLQRLVKSLLSIEGYEGFESSVSVAHLENRVAAALTLGARDEFKVYLNMYTKRLGSEGARLKIEELLRSLLKGVYSDSTDGTDSIDNTPFPGRGGDLEAGSDMLCGWKKETLVKEVILILGKYRDLQRITVPYARLLGMTEGELGDLEMNGS